MNNRRFQYKLFRLKQYSYYLLGFCIFNLLIGCVSETRIKGTGQLINQAPVGKEKAALIRIKLGLEYLQKGEFKIAKANLITAIEYAPNYAEGHNALGYYFQTVGEHALAKQYYKQAIQFDKKNGDYLNNYGAFLCRLGEFSVAEQQFLQAIALIDYLKITESYENAGLCAIKDDRFQDAISFFHKAYIHSNKAAKFSFILAGIHYSVAEYTQAQRWLAKHQKAIINNNAEILLLKHLLALRLGRLTEARDRTKELITIFPQSEQTKWLKQQTVQNFYYEQLRQYVLNVEDRSKQK